MKTLKRITTRQYSGFTLLEVVTALGITAILMPVVTIVFYQILTIPPEQSARLNVLNDIQILSTMLYQDGFSADNFSAGDGEPYYGNFSWTNYEEYADYSVSYYYTNGKIAREETVTELPLPTTTPVPTPTAPPTPTPMPPTPTPVPVATPSSGQTVFTSSDTWTVPYGVESAQVLVVGGGGGGGGAGVALYAGGGGGGGGVVYNASYPLTPGADVTVTVGAGGVGGNGNDAGDDGGNSVFDGSITAYGGGGGGTQGGRNGASGGGGGLRTSTEYNGGSATQGNSGARGFYASQYIFPVFHYWRAGGGGGGAGASGTEANKTTAPNGGVGVDYSSIFGAIGGDSGWFGGGGGGGAGNDASAGSGGTGGGGTGHKNAGSGGSATASTGGGGGGAYSAFWSYNGGSGGSGIIAAKYTTGCYNLTTTAGANGSVVVPGEGNYSYNKGEIVNIAAVPDECYQFVNWTGDHQQIADRDSAYTTITMRNDYSIQANFEPRPYTLELSVWGPLPATPGDPSGAGTYDCGTNASIQANPREGFVFDYWAPSDGVANASAANTTVLMSQARHIKCYYSLAPIGAAETTTMYLTSHVTQGNFSLSKPYSSDYVIADILANVSSSGGEYIEKQLTLYIAQRAKEPGLGRGGIWGESAVVALGDLEISGEVNLFNGDLYVNGTVTVSAAHNSVTGTLYNDSLVLTGGGTDFTYGDGVSPCPDVSMPELGDPQNKFTNNLSTPIMDTVNHEFIFSGDIDLTDDCSECWISRGSGWGPWSSVSVLEPGYYYSPGTITLSDKAVRGQVTFIADEIVIENTTTGGIGDWNEENYIGLDYWDADGLLLWARDSGSNVIWIKGQSGAWNPCVMFVGMLFAPDGEIELQGYGSTVSGYSNAYITSGGIIGQDLTVSGKDWFIYRW
jgi:hypothetical protein